MKLVTNIVPPNGYKFFIRKAAKPQSEQYPYELVLAPTGEGYEVSVEIDTYKILNNLDGMAQRALLNLKTILIEEALNSGKEITVGSPRE